MCGGPYSGIIPNLYFFYVRNAIPHGLATIKWRILIVKVYQIDALDSESYTAGI
jgi:hypothetical protein